MTLSRGAYPGESAQFVVQRLGLYPELSPTHPVWVLLADLFLRIPVGGDIFRLNLISAVLGAVAIGLLYTVVMRALLGFVETDTSNQRRVAVAIRLAGVAAAISLAFCIPFWIAATRAHPATLDICWLLIVTLVLQTYSRAEYRCLALLFAFLYGVGVVEFTTLVILAPLFGGWLVFLLWQKNELRPATILQLVACALAGLSLYLLNAWRFYGSAGYVWRLYRGFWHIIWIVWRDQFFLITRSLPQRGWLLILIITAAPWLAALAVARRALNEEKDWTYYALHVIMTGLAVCVLLNLPVAPWPMVGGARLLVTPYVLTASLFGYLVAYWFLLPAAWCSGLEGRLGVWARNGLGALLITPLLALGVAAPLKNLPQADGRPAALLNAFARDIMKCVGARTWLVTDGVIDHVTALAARELGRPLKLIDVSAANSPAYMKYVASNFEQPRLKNLCRIGLLPFLKGWFESDPAITNKAAVMSMPDLWMAAGFQPVPNRIMFVGTRERRDVDAERLMVEHEEFWKESIPKLKRISEQSGFLGIVGRYLLQVAGMAANDLGVLMEDLGRQADAWRAYVAARGIDTNNISALLNMNIMLERGWTAEEAEMVRQEIQKLKDMAESRKPSLWSLARNYGYVRAPHAYAALGWTWALSGTPGLAVSELKRAMDLVPGNEDDVLRQMLANLYMLQQKDDESEALYTEMLRREATNHTALLGLSRIALQNGNLDRAAKLLDRAEAAGAPKSPVLLQRALLTQATGKAAEAREQLEGLLSATPEYLPAYVALADLLIGEGDIEALNPWLEKLRRLPRSDAYVASVKAAVAAREGDWEAARLYLREALTSMPNNLQFLERLVKVELLRGNLDEAGQVSRKLLRLDPENAVGNYVMGALQLKEGEKELAEDSFRHSLRRQRSVPALNDLAWLLTEKGEYSEAESLVREVLAVDENLAQAWDTLGVILLRTGRLAEAEKALERSLSIYQGDPSVFLHMLEVQVVRGNLKRARELVPVLYDKLGRLSAADQEKLNTLSRQADEGLAGGLDKKRGG